MKLSEITGDNYLAITYKWLKDYKVGFDIGPNEYDYQSGQEEDIIDKFGYISRGVSRIKLEAEENVTFTWPIQPKLNNTHFILELTGKPKENKRLTIESFKDFPKVGHLVLDGVTIKSLDGIENLSGQLYIEFWGDVEYDGGIMRLLKAGNINFEVFMQDSDLQKALYTAEQYRINKGDIADCMDELIEMGLKRYAKT